MEEKTPKWPRQTPDVVEKLKKRITELIENDEQASKDFDLFMHTLHKTPDGSVKITRDDAIQLFAIYLVTKPVQEAIL